METKAILFDFDGTLVDSAPGIVKTMEQTFLKMGVAVPDEATMRSTIGLPLREALQRLSHVDDAGADHAAALYRELFPVYEVAYITVFDGILPMLQRLREQGIRLAIVTSRDTQSLDLVMGKRGLSPYFETRVTGADGFAPKPAPDMVEALLERMNLQREETVVVGDTTFDIEMGNSAGCRTVAVSYGNHSRVQLQAVHPTHIVDTPEALLQVLGIQG